MEYICSPKLAARLTLTVQSTPRQTLWQQARGTCSTFRNAARDRFDILIRDFSPPGTI